jgi:hypothetical protein
MEGTMGEKELKFYNVIVEKHFSKRQLLKLENQYLVFYDKSLIGNPKMSYMLSLKEMKDIKLVPPRLIIDSVEKGKLTVTFTEECDEFFAALEKNLGVSKPELKAKSEIPPKLGLIGWGFAGGFLVSSGMPGSILGSFGVAIVVLGAYGFFKAGLPQFSFLSLIIGLILVGLGYSRYSNAYEHQKKETENLSKKNSG